MKTYLARLATALFVVAAIASGAIAQEVHLTKKTFNHKLAFEAFEKCLQRSDVPGFVESSLYTIAECKSRFPELNYSRLIEDVNRVAQRNASPALRYKAYLVSMYLTHGSEITVTPIRDADSYDYLFKQIANQLEQKYLALGNSENAVENRR